MSAPGSPVTRPAALTDADELAYLSARDLIGLYRRGWLAPIEAVRALYERARQYGDLNALLATEVGSRRR